MPVSKRFFLGRAKVPGFLDGLEASGGITGSLYLPARRTLAQVSNALAEVAIPEAIPADLPKIAAGSATGSVLFWSQPKQYLLIPPFPVAEEQFVRGYEAEPLRSLLSHDYRIAMVLVRLGSYAIGLCEGEKLITSKVGTGLIHGRHRQGGSSAQRFALRREKQIDSFLERVCGHIRERLEPPSKTVDYIVYGGARMTILQLRKQCPFLRQFDDRELPPLLDIPEPRQAVLETAIGRVWSSKVTEWRGDEIA